MDNLTFVGGRRKFSSRLSLEIGGRRGDSRKHRGDTPSGVGPPTGGRRNLHQKR